MYIIVLHQVKLRAREREREREREYAIDLAYILFEPMGHDTHIVIARLSFS